MVERRKSCWIDTGFTIKLTGGANSNDEEKCTAESFVFQLAKHILKHKEYQFFFYNCFFYPEFDYQTTNYGHFDNCHF